MKFFSRAKKIGFTIPNFSNAMQKYEGSECNKIDGKILSAHFIEEAIKLSQGKKKPNLAVILSGENPASHVYVNNKIKLFKKAGFESKSFIISSQETTEDKLTQLIEKLNKDISVHGILVQLPLPSHINSVKILNTIDPKKDVDGFLASNMGSLATGEFARSIACTPFGIMTLLCAYGYHPANTRAVVVGRSNIVGKPMGLLLLSEDATVTIAHSKTLNLKKITKEADILIAAAGRPEMIDASFIKEGAVVIDVGIHKKANGKLCGDVHPDVLTKATALSPVPGGVGPMTIAMLLLNTALVTWEN